MSRSPIHYPAPIAIVTQTDESNHSVINTHNANHHSPLLVPVRENSDRERDTSEKKGKFKLKWHHVKAAFIMIGYFIVLYGVLALIFWGLMEAMLADTETTLIVFGILWLINIAVIIGMVIYGVKTDQLTKYANRVERSRENPEEEHLSPNDASDLEAER
jgi:hypothetical protein